MTNLRFDAMRLALMLGLGAVLAGCAVGPDYQPPTQGLGSAYGALATPSVNDARNRGWIAAQAAQAPLPGNWWKAFGDSTLVSLMQALQQNNLSIIKAEAQYRQALAVLRQTRAGFFPTLGTSASATRSGTGTDTAGNQSTQNQYSASGTVSWEPDVWGRIRRSAEGGQAGTEASQADLQAMRLSMESTLAQTYFQLRAADTELQLLGDTVQAYERSLQLVQNRFQAGVASQADVETSRTQLENARAQYVSRQRERAQFENALAVLVGQPPSGFRVPAQAGLPPLPVVPVGVPSELLLRRPDVVAAERRTAQANAQIGVAQSAWFPNLTLSAQAGFRSGQWAQWLTAPASFWSLGPALALTLFDGGAREGRLQEVRAAYDAQVADYRQTALTALREVEDYLVSLDLLAQQQAVQGRALAAARESLRLTRNQYDAGLIDYLSVVQVETTALTAERTALGLRADRLLASVQLIAALGGGWSGLVQPAGAPAETSAKVLTPSAIN
jgi:NodT family efflux transporter outer membrane factor (OMF) lipoprotein